MNLYLKVSVAQSLFVHRTYMKLIHNRPLVVVIAWKIFGSVMGVPCVLCSILSVVARYVRVIEPYELR